MSEVSSTLLKVQLSEFIPEPEPVVPDTDGNTPGTSNTGFHTTIQSEADSSAAETTNHAVPIAFFGLAFFILTFIIISLVKKHKNPYAIEGRSTRLTKLQVLSAATASVFLAVVFNSAIFSTPYIGPVDTEVSEELTIKADILGTDNSAYVKDTIVLPASEYGYDLYISTDDTNDNRLIADSTEGIIDSITAEGPLANDTYGFSFVDPAVDNTKFQPIQLKDSGKTSVLSLSPEQTATEQHIDIWYGVRSKELEEDVYRTNIEYLTIGRQALPLEEMTPEICASLETGVIDYEFTNSFGETQYVSKLADGNCWTKPVPTEDPSEPSPVLACPTNWHEAKQNDYSELDIFYHVKDPATTADPIIVEYDQTAEHPEGGCVADFFETTATFEHNDGPDSIGMPDPITVDATDFESTITMPDVLGDSPLKSHFRGWSLTPDGTAPLYQPADEVTFTSPSVTLYAIWDERIPKAILDENGLLNFVYDYHTVQEVIDDVEGYRTAYESTHAPIKTEGVNCTTACVYLVPERANNNSLAPWIISQRQGNSDIITANFEESFIGFKPISTLKWFYRLANLSAITGLERNLNSSKLINTGSMFEEASSLTNIYFSNDFGSHVTSMSYMFRGASSLTSLDFPDGFGTETIYMSGMFEDATSLTSLDFPDGFGSEAKSMGDMFAFLDDYSTYASGNCRQSSIERISFPVNFGKNVESVMGMFACFSAPVSLDFPDGFGSKAKNMDYMFLGSKARAINIPSDVDHPENNFGSKAETMHRMFFNGTANLSSLNLPTGFGSQAIDMQDMFYHTYGNNPSLTSISFPEGFGSAAKNMQDMFRNYKTLASITFPDGFGSQAINMSGMFAEDYSLSSIDSSNGHNAFPDGFGSQATNMSAMFANARLLTFLIFPNNFGSQVINTSSMFDGDTALSHIYVAANTDWNNGDVTNSTDMFRTSGTSAALSLPGWSAQNANDITNAHINGQGSTTGYFTDVCELYGTCATNSGAASTNSLTGPEETQQSPQSVSPNSETPSNISPLGAKATKIDNSLAILFAIAMACLFAGTTMLILIIEKVKRDYREENDQF